jgi:hypothetical protein
VHVGPILGHTIPGNLSFIRNSVSSLATTLATKDTSASMLPLDEFIFLVMSCLMRMNSCHKGYKCLDVATGRVYISRDVMFDENDFPFLQFHSNAGTQLRAKILLLPPTLRNYHRDDLVDGHLAHGANPVADQVTENHGVLVDEHGHSALDIGRSMDPLATTDLSESSLDHTPDNGLRSAPGSGLNSTSRGSIQSLTCSRLLCLIMCSARFTVLDLLHQTDLVKNPSYVTTPVLHKFLISLL